MQLLLCKSHCGNASGTLSEMSVQIQVQPVIGLKNHMMFHKRNGEATPWLCSIKKIFHSLPGFMKAEAIVLDTVTPQSSKVHGDLRSSLGG